MYSICMLCSSGIGNTELVIFCRKLILVLFLHLPRCGSFLNSYESDNDHPHLVKGGEIVRLLSDSQLLSRNKSATV